MNRALVFPGQGAQAVGMLQSFADSKPVRDTFAEAAEVLGQDLWQLAADGPAEDLNSTVNTQPLMLAAGYAVYRAWREAGGPAPAIVAGHSLGEYTALVVAGVVSLRDALPLVRLRAQAMQDAVPVGTGAMAAILGLDDDAVRAACAVIAGHKAAVERAAAAAKVKGAKRAVMLPVSAPFHASLLKPAAERLKQVLSGITFHAPQIPIVNNVDVAVVTDPQLIKAALARQACSPVRWVEIIQHMARSGVTHVGECGPGKVLAGMTRRIESGLQGFAIADAASLAQSVQALKEAADA